MRVHLHVTATSVVGAPCPIRERKARSLSSSPSFPYYLGDSESGMIFLRRGQRQQSRGADDSVGGAPKMMIYFAPVLPIFGSSAKTRNPFLHSAGNGRSKVAVPLHCFNDRAKSTSAAPRVPINAQVSMVRRPPIDRRNSSCHTRGSLSTRTSLQKPNSKRGT